MRITGSIAAALALAASAACSRKPATTAAPADPAFAAMQRRGQMAMGVDQYTSTHSFDALPDGGRIELLRDIADTLGIRQIQAHLRLIEHAFQAGDFSTPEFVHLQKMPGTDVMARKHDLIVYRYSPLPRGGEVRMTTSDPEALAAIHAFIAAQRGEHHAGGAGMGEH
jgi:hypothetical protein